MKGSARKTKENGGALAGIVIILAILIVAGYFLYQNVRKQTDLIQNHQAKTAAEAGLNLDANAAGSLTN
ncbi:MAG: hypothetical protein WCG55_02620 [bacterium]